MGRALVVVNPAAGGGRSERAWPGVRERLTRAGFEFEWTATRAAGDAIRLAREGARAGHPLVVAVGGDGTVNEVANGVTGDDGVPLATMGAILTGRGRDVCRNVGVPLRPEAAAAVLVSGADATFDLGMASWHDGRRRYFLGAAGAGFDAAVAARAASVGARGTLPYLFAVLATLGSYRPQVASIHVDGAPVWQGPLAAAVVANGRYFGGGMKIAPAADPADGRLDLVVLGAFTRLEMLRWLPTIYPGRHLANPHVVTHRAAAVSVDAPVPLPTHVDGEVSGTTPLTLTIVPRALRLRVPRGG
jgi:YegS/Rv2252/BmrU family lipid kinase